MSGVERTFRLSAALAFSAMMLLGGCVVAINTGEPRTEEAPIEAREISGEAA